MDLQVRKQDSKQDYNTNEEFLLKELRTDNSKEQMEDNDIDNNWQQGIMRNILLRM